VQLRGVFLHHLRQLELELVFVLREHLLQLLLPELVLLISMLGGQFLRLNL
jgi:hypothetical protein